MYVDAKEHRMFIVFIGKYFNNIQKIFSFLFLCDITAKPGYTTQNNACSLYAL